MEESQRAICIYGASSSNIDPRFMDDAFETGRLIALSGYALVSGGGRGGLMAAAIEGALSVGGHTIGVLPQFMIEREWQHPQLSRLIVTESMHERKHTMARLSAGVIALPGGIGTLEELMEIITWRQLGLYAGKVSVLNTLGYYDPLLQMLTHSAECGFMRRSAQSRLYEVATTPQAAVELVTTIEEL